MKAIPSYKGIHSVKAKHNRRQMDSLPAVTREPRHGAGNDTPRDSENIENEGCATPAQHTEPISLYSVGVPREVMRLLFQCRA